MQTIEYRVHFTGNYDGGKDYGYGTVETEIVTVQARTINSGYPKAIKIGREPLGNGKVREISQVEFWQIR